MLMTGAMPSAMASSVNMDEAEYRRRISRFNKTQRPIAPSGISRALSWSDMRTTVKNHKLEVDLALDPGGK